MLSILGLLAGEPFTSQTGAPASQGFVDAGALDPVTTNAGDDSQQLQQRIYKPGGIALALGGGAAKGWAHIGVLRAFEEEKIPVSMVAGTSIGALVGGCYLAGKLDDLEHFARSLTRSNIFRYMDFSITGSGIIAGSRLAATLDRHMHGLTIEQLPMPFVSVCTDIRTGHEIWLSDGPLIEALRASYALPGVFAPIVHGGRHLVDGALVNPVPVSACRAYEPDVVIAIDLNSENFGRGTVIRASHYAERETAWNQDAAHGSQARHGSWLPFLRSGEHKPHETPGTLRTLVQPKVQPKQHLGTMGVMMEAFNIIQDRISRARLAGDPPDYTIRPKLFSIGLADFHKADESIRIGYTEAKKTIRELADQGELQSA